jgi:hypothetical protein
LVFLQTRIDCSLALGRVQALSDMTVTASESRAQKTAGPDLPHSSREPDVGSAADHGELKILGSVSRRERWSAGCGGRQGTGSRRSDGPPRFWTITEKRLLQSTSLRATLTFCVLYCFFVISNNRRRILQSNVTEHPSSVGMPTVAQRISRPFTATVSDLRPSSEFQRGRCSAWHTSIPQLAHIAHAAACNCLL